MNRTYLPYVFLAFLLSILLFIVGLRYGQHVERVNETMTVLISIPPSPTLQPTQKPLTFSDYSHPGCKIGFLIPDILEKTRESSVSALFRTGNSLKLALSCEKKPFQKTEKEVQVGLTKTIRAYETKTKDMISYRFYHVNTAKVVTITVDKSLLPLLQKSLTISQ